MRRVHEEAWYRMASVRTNKETGSKTVLAYAGINPRTRKPKYVSTTLPATATDAEIEEAKERMDAKAAVSKGDVNLMTIQTVVEYYLDISALGDMAKSSLSSYWSYTRCHINTRIGNIPFDSADAKLFSGFFYDLRRPKEDGGAGLAQSTVKKIHAFLSGCFNTLKGEGVIPANPMADVKVKPGDYPEAKPLTPSDFVKLRQYLLDVLSRPVSNEDEYEEHTFATILWADLHTGIRRGEISGLQLRHEVEGFEIEPATGDYIPIPALRIARVIVQIKDKEKDRLIVKDKTKGGRARTVTIDELTDEYLTAHDAIQAAVLAEHGVRTTDTTPLFAHADGSIFTPAQLTDAMKAIVSRLGLESYVHLHTLRHTHATYLLEEGEPIRRVQERLGHKDVQTTLRLYGHVLPGSDAATAKRFAATGERMMKRQCNAVSSQYVPTCPRTGETCCRFDDSFLEN